MTHPIINREQALAIQREFGTPIYVYSEKILREQASKALAFQAPYGLTVRYAMKANPNRSILRILNEMGVWIDASSGFEASRAMMAGIPAEQIMLTAQELPHNLKELVEAGIDYNACSLNQLEAYGKLFPGTQVTVRINPGKGSGFNPKVDVAGSEASFGIWHEHLDQVHALAEKYQLTFHRVHTHIGSGTDPDEWAEVAKTCIALLHHFPDATRMNLGGGFKVGRVPEEKTADLQAISQKISEILQAFHEETGREIHLEIEPGTYLTANTGVILSRIQDLTQTNSEHHFIKLDAGMTEIIRPAMYGSQHPMTIIPQTPNGDNSRYYYVVGHCCETADSLAVEYDNPGILKPRHLSSAKIGDLLLIGGAGAYCAGMSAKHYNSFPEAAEVLVQKDGELQLIRRRQNLEQLVENEL